MSTNTIYIYSPNILPSTFLLLFHPKFVATSIWDEKVHHNFILGNLVAAISPGHLLLCKLYMNFN